MKVLQWLFFAAFAACAFGMQRHIYDADDMAGVFFVGVFVFAFAAGVADTLAYVRRRR